IPICDNRHYNLFVVNRRDKQYEFLDSKYPRGFEVKWRPTADKVVQYATSYFRNLCGESDFGEYKWVIHKGVRQKQGSQDCGIFLLNWAEVWEGKVEDYTCLVSGRIKNTVKIVATPYVLFCSIQRTITCSLK
ncbi:hypothetical protein LINPERHAP2_LOCUS12856, partial [Linum perenne]